MSLRSLLLGAGLVAVAAALGWAAPRGPLPVFELASLEGGALTSTQVVREGRWLLVYVSPHSGASGPLLRALEGSEKPDAPSVVVVVGSEAADAKTMAARSEGRLEATWCADPSGAARRALGLTGVPVVLGLQGGEIQWTLSGAVADRRTLRSILASWR